MIKVELKSGDIKELENEISVFDAAKSISEGLARVATCASVNDEIVDLRYIINKDAKLNILTFDTKEGKSAYWHTTSHILAGAVKRLFPKTKLAIGPSIDNGFYYDFDPVDPFTPEDLEKIEAEMNKIIKENFPIEQYVLDREEAIKYFKEQDEPYKIELIEDLPENEKISFYRLGEFTDLCRGPHLMSTGAVKAFKLTNVAGAYWRGNEKNKMLVRIYGTSFTKKADLEEYLLAVEEAKKRDHNKIGRELGIFATDEAVGQGLPLIMPKGAKIIQILQRFVEDEEERRGYVRTMTPYMAKSDLYKLSGHWDHYKEGMFVLGDEEKDDEVFALRPMTCPFQFKIYNQTLHSYRDLPIRYGETSTLFRNESSGEMHGLIRVRQFTISEGHLVCTPEQLEEEFLGVLDLINYMMNILGFAEDISYRFSKWDPSDKGKYIDMPQQWEKIEKQMKGFLDKIGLEYEEAIGEAAFYGPKLDIQMKNVHGKEDTIITVQIDFALAERLDMFYVDKDNQKMRPLTIHRTSIGCYERTLAMLIEKYAGAFPLWLAPMQVKIMPISDNHNDYAVKVMDTLKNLGLRAEVDARNEKIGKKIREAQIEKIPYMLVIGDKESSENAVAVRSWKDGDKGAMNLEDFAKMVKLEHDNKVR